MYAIWEEFIGKVLFVNFHKVRLDKSNLCKKSLNPSAGGVFSKHIKKITIYGIINVSYVCAIFKYLPLQIYSTNSRVKSVCYGVISQLIDKTSMLEFF